MGNEATEEFDRSIGSVNNSRSSIYGHPLSEFTRAAQIRDAVSDCPDPAIRNALEMIGVKMARLCTTPDHLDSIIDIAGYARTIAMILDKRKEDHPWV